MADPATADQFPCIVKDCPWPAELHDGMWVCEKHNEASYVWDDEAKVIWPKIGEMDARIRGATERLIRHLHLEKDAFAMLLALTEVALGLEERTKNLPETKPRTDEAFKR